MKKILETLKRKWAEYLLETFVIMIGILGAFMLNTWKSDTDEKVKILEYVDGLSNDLNHDNERINTLYEFYKNKANSIQILIECSNQKHELTNDELGKMFNQIIDFRKFTNKKSNYLTLLNTGYLNMINNKDLLNEIIIYYETPYLIWSTEIYGNIIESVDYNQSEFYDSRDRLIGLSMNNEIPEWKLTNKKYHTDYVKVINSKWCINILTSCLKQSNFIFNNIKEYKLMNEKLRESINNYENEG